ncbi:MAG TPA: PAS domain S-box protein [Polyangia bacterium]|jgi:PAS domain S-box-containing protein
MADSTLTGELTEQLRLTLGSLAESERRRKAAITLLGQLAEARSRKEFLEGAVTLLQRWSSCRCVGVRILNDRGDVPYEAHVGFSQDFWAKENLLSVRHDACACTRVMLGTPEAGDRAAMTPGGSFACNHVGRFVSALGPEQQSRFRGVCAAHGFMTVVIVPLRHRDEIVGAVHFADERPSMMSPRAVGFIEAAAPLIGEAVHRFAIEERLRYQAGLIDEVSDAIISTDTRLTVRSWNRAAERLYGWTAAEAQGRLLPEVVGTTWSGKRRDQVIAQVFERGAWRGEAVHRRSDGSRVEVLVSASALPDAEGLPIGMVVITSDISALRRAQKKLRRREVYYRSLLENALDITLVVDVEGVVRYVNPAVERALGFAPEDLVGQPAAALTHPDDRAALATAYGRIAELGEVVSAEFRCRHHDGSWRYFEGIGKRLAKPRPRFIINARDVTDRRRMMEQLLQAQKMEAVGRLAGGVAHDFNNLLMVMKGYAGLIKEELSPTGQLEFFVDEILKAANRAARLPRQLLAFSRRQMLEPRVIDLNELVIEMDKMLRRLIGEDIELVTVTAPEPALVRVDPGQIEQLVVNLAVNARDAMPQGGKLRVAVAFAAGAAPEADSVVLTVSDTGSGMKDEVKAHLFEPFYTTKEVGRGTGLGLATVYGIVQQHQGAISVESEWGQGTTFHIRLRRVAGSLTPASANAAAGRVPGGHETVLLVEDEPTLRAIVLHVLKRLGYAVLEAEHGEAALRVAAEHAGVIDLLLTDVVMPLMSGWELQQRLVLVRPNIRTLFVSGYTENPIVREGGTLAAGTAFLPKPFEEIELARKVRELLDEAAG